LGPILFLVYTNDFNEYIKHITLKIICRWVMTVSYTKQ
jgi:hypothetical protein